MSPTALCIIIAAVFLSPHLSESQGKWACVVCLVAGVVFFTLEASRR